LKPKRKRIYEGDASYHWTGTRHVSLVCMWEYEKWAVLWRFT